MGRRKHAHKPRAPLFMHHPLVQWIVVSDIEREEQRKLLERAAKEKDQPPLVSFTVEAVPDTTQELAPGTYQFQVTVPEPTPVSPSAPDQESPPDSS